MMRDELLDEISRLPVTEQKSLVEEIERRLNLQAKQEAASRLEGLLGHTSDEPTTEQVKEDYAAYLEAKYR